MSLNYRDDLQADILPSYTDSLMHHGIKGQHWGVRRPRNEDGIIQGAGAKLAAQQKAHQEQADYWRKGADQIKAKQKQVLANYEGRGLRKAIGRGATNVISNAAAKHFTKKAAKAQYNADKFAAAKKLHDWGEKANRGYAKNHDDARMARSAEKAIDRFNAANQAAKKRYKQTVNADKIAMLQKKASYYQKAAGRDSSMQKHMRKQRGAMRALTAPVSAIAGTNRMINQAKADRARARAKRLGG